MLLVGFYGPSVAAVDAADFTSCMVFSEAEEDKGDKKDGEEETVQLMSHLGPLEEGDNRPCITIMTPEEYEAETAQ